MAHKIELRLAPVRETLDARLAANEAGRYGFAFVDADKSGDDAYYERCPQLLRQGGLVAIDNTLWGGSVARPATPTPGRCSGSKPSRTATSASTCPCCPSARPDADAQALTSGGRTQTALGRLRARTRRRPYTPSIARPASISAADSGSGTGETARMSPRISPPGNRASWMLMYANPASMPAMLAALTFANPIARAWSRIVVRQQVASMASPRLPRPAVQAAAMKPQNARTVAVVVLAAAAIFVLHRLVAPILWAAVIAVGTWPLHDRLRRFAGGRWEHLSAVLLTGAVVVFLGVPFTYLALRGRHEMPELLRLWTSSQQAGLPVPEWVAQLPGGGAWAVRQWNEAIGDPGALSDSVHSLLRRLNFATGRSLLAELTRHAMAFFFCVLVLFFLYFDGDAFAAQIDTIVARQFGPAGRRGLALVVRSVRGAVNGLVLVGLGVGVLMAIAYGIAGVPHAAAVGLVTGLFGIVPFGATVILALVVLYLFTIGSMATAIALAVFGLVAIFVADHFVRPVFMAAGSKLPLVLALLGIVGGLETFGLLGLFLGPTLLAVVVAVWRELAAPSADADAAA